MPHRMSLNGVKAWFRVLSVTVWRIHVAAGGFRNLPVEQLHSQARSKIRRLLSIWTDSKPSSVILGIEFIEPSH